MARSSPRGSETRHPNLAQLRASAAQHRIDYVMLGSLTAFATEHKKKQFGGVLPQPRALGGFSRIQLTLHGRFGWLAALGFFSSSSRQHPSLLHSQLRDAAQVLADMRQALGGDALKTVRRSRSRAARNALSAGPRSNANVEWAGILPDRFIEDRHHPSTTLSPQDSTEMPSFARSKERSAGAAVRLVPAEPPRLSEATRHNMMILAKQHFSRLTVGMFGLTPVYPLDATYISREMLDGKPVHLLELRGPNDYVARLCVDVSSHLPRMISWMGRPAHASVSPLLRADTRLADGGAQALFQRL